MRIGIISKGSPDYLIDIVTDGIIRLLGRQGVALDYNARGGWGGQYSILLKNFSGPEPYDINDADALIASTRSIDAARAWQKVTGRKKVVILDGEDGPELNDIYKEVPLYFKREFLKHRYYPPNIKPLPFGAIPEELPAHVDLKQEVFFRCHETHSFRGLVRKTIEEMGFPISTARLEKKEYNDLLMGSLVGVSTRGNGWDTYRYWETAFFGVAILSQRLDIVLPDDFEEGREARYFSDMDELRLKLIHMLADPDRTIAMGQAARKKCLDRHLSIHRARTVLEALA
jgi:hypothetical protein